MAVSVRPSGTFERASLLRLSESSSPHKCRSHLGFSLVCCLLMLPGKSTIDRAIEHLRSVLELPAYQALSLIDPVSDAQVPGQRAVGPWDNQVLVLRTERRNG